MMETKTVSFFSFCNFFEFLTSRTEKVVWLKPIVFKTDFSYFWKWTIRENLKKLHDATIFYCLIPSIRFEFLERLANFFRLVLSTSIQAIASQKISIKWNNFLKYSSKRRLHNMIEAFSYLLYIFFIYLYISYINFS